MIKNKNRPLWLDFDNEEFEKNQSDKKYTGCLLNITVTNDNEGGNGECTTITFDTDDYGGTPMTVAALDGKDNHIFDAGKVSITIWGGWEASNFFAAMKNLIHSYKLRQKLGE